MIKQKSWKMSSKSGEKKINKSLKQGKANFEKIETNWNTFLFKTASQISRKQRKNCKIFNTILVPLSILVKLNTNCFYLKTIWCGNFTVQHYINGKSVPVPVHTFVFFRSVFISAGYFLFTSGILPDPHRTRYLRIRIREDCMHSADYWESGSEKNLEGGGKIWATVLYGNKSGPSRNCLASVSEPG